MATIDPDTSGWSVGQHVAHLWLAADGICRWIESAVDEAGAPPGGDPSPTGRVILISGWIPRGRAQAPEPTVPRPEVDPDLIERFDGLRELTDRLEPRLADVHSSRSTFEHPLLGHFTPSQWLRFLDVHHHHHEKIIRDIFG